MEKEYNVEAALEQFKSNYNSYSKDTNNEEYLESQELVLLYLKMATMKQVLDNLNIDKNELTPKDVFGYELLNWGIDGDKFAYKAIMALLEVKNARSLPYKDICKAVAEITNTNAGTVSAAYTYIKHHANFSNSNFIPLFAVMPSEQITKENIVYELLDYVN